MHQHEPLKQWTPCRDEYLDDLNRLEGRGQYTSDHCPSCSLISPSIIADDLDLPRNRATVRCRDCFGEDLLVFLQKWNGSYIEPTTLTDIGLGASSRKMLFKPPPRVSRIHCHPYQRPPPCPRWLLRMWPFRRLWLPSTTTPSAAVVSCYTQRALNLCNVRSAQTLSHAKFAGQGRWLRLLLSTGETYGQRRYEQN
jgi:hypothetical protein